MNRKISKIFSKAIVVIASVCLFISCEKDDVELEPTLNWKAETIVDENEVAATGVSNWFRAEEISDEVFSRMWLKSWKENCPLDRSELRYLKVLHRNADGKPQRGEMVVNAAIADKVLTIFMQLYEAGYRIERMVLIDNFDADDESSMRANNSSSFNFRFMTGSTTKISKHGLGLAIDINTLYNPYVKQKSDGTWHIEPATREEYAFNRDNRTDIPYKIDHEDLAYKLFTAAGFEWGGDWTSLKDYQHFEIQNSRLNMIEIQHRLQTIDAVADVAEYCIDECISVDTLRTCL